MQDNENFPSSPQLGLMNPKLDESKSGAGNFEVPKYRIKNANQGRNLIRKMEEGQIKRQKRWDKVNAMVDGNSPLNAGVMASRGVKYSNLNWQVAKYRLAGARADYWNTIFNVARLMAIESHVQGVPTGQLLAWDRAKATNLHRALYNSQEFTDNIYASLTSGTKLGHGTFVFQSSKDGLPKHIRKEDILLPINAPGTSTRMTVIALRDEINPIELYGNIADEDSATRIGWNVENAKIALANQIIGNSGTDRSYNYITYLQDRIRNNDLLYALEGADTIKVYHILEREFDGSVTHYILTQAMMKGYEKDEEDSGFLYKRNSKEKKLQDIVHLFGFDVDSTQKYHAVKGYIEDSWAWLQNVNRLYNRLMDSVVRGSSTFLKAQDSTSAETLTLIETVGGVTIIPQNLDVIQNASPNMSNGVLQVAERLIGHMDRNEGRFTPTYGAPSKDYQSTSAKTIDVTAQTTLQAVNISLYLVQLSALYKEIYVRFTAKDVPENSRHYDMIKLFQKRCKEDGVPDEILHMDPDDVTVVCSGIGSLASGALRQQTLKEVLDMSSLQGMDQSAILDDYLASRVGPNAARIYKPEQGVDNSSQAAYASLEDALFKVGQDAMVSPTHFHLIHVMTHFHDMVGAIQNLQQSGGMPQGKAPIPMSGQPAPMNLDDLHTVAQMLQHGIPHAQEHLQFLQKDPTQKQQANIWTAQIGQLENTAKSLITMAEQAKQSQEQGQQGNQMTPDQQLKLMEIQAKTQELDMKTKLMQAEAQDKAAELQHRSQLREMEIDKMTHDVTITKLQNQVEEALALLKKGDKGKEDNE